MDMRRPVRPAPKKSSNAPLVIGAVVLLAGVGLVAMRGGGNSAAGRTTAQNASPAAVPAAPVRDEVAEKRAKYIRERSTEISLENFRGAPSSAIPDDVMACMKAQSDEQAVREWDALCLVLGEAERIGRAKGEVDVYRAAADLVWPITRDLARYGGTPGREWVTSQLEAGADKVRLEARLRR